MEMLQFDIQINPIDGVFGSNQKTLSNTTINLHMTILEQQQQSTNVKTNTNALFALPTSNIIYRRNNMLVGVDTIFKICYTATTDDIKKFGFAFA